MAKPDHIYICQSCGAHAPKWSGKCEDCGAWNTLSEESIATIPKGLDRHQKTTKTLTTITLDGTNTPADRLHSNIGEFDRVCGGGLVPGSILLVGGDPGIGKSTLMLQLASALSRRHQCLYISGEEGVEQIRLRAGRLGLTTSAIQFLAATNLREIIATLETKETWAFVVVDSIQTMYLDSIDSAPGTVTQVRTCAQELIQVAKKHNIIIILVGHVTKEGTIAGPRVLEHMVDGVLYFEGERGHQFRILRAVKNRFGPADEIGIFEMTGHGLQEVANPSQIFLPARDQEVDGSAVFAGMEGTRPVLIEIQTLIATTNFGMPRRTVVGWDSSRLAMIIAVLEARAGLSFGNKDVFINVAGGLKIQEPAADLSVAASLISALTGRALPSKTVIFGEIGLSGEIRAVSHAQTRLKEASKLGFTTAYVPWALKVNASIKEKLSLFPLKHITELVALIEGNT